MLQIYFGNGKGKTTAAFGQALRAAGAGMRVVIFQFLKDNSSSERKALSDIENITLIEGLSFKKPSWEFSAQEIAQAAVFYEKALGEISKLSFDMLVLDEALWACELGYIREAPLVSLIKRFGADKEIILTGAHAGKFLELADYASCIEKVKHPYDKGISARPGIEY
ncbi:MAG: cob(I)yrinic acid a,c-diamide adenosyltransferase [Clostridiales bacterium]|nr:cob(I)yrinic acid a,c-diamide adenosyltransferase [Clostridiales bacterium]